jgi:hypothetical protein
MKQQQQQQQQQKCHDKQMHLEIIIIQNNKKDK